MRYRKLTTTGDYSFGHGLLDFWIDVPMAVGQNVQTWLQLWQGEWYLNTADGTPYLTNILGKQTQASADAALQQTILSINGVTDIASYESTVNSSNRSMSVSAMIDTVYGQTPVQIAELSLF